MLSFKNTEEEFTAKALRSLRSLRDAEEKRGGKVKAEKLKI